MLAAGGLFARASTSGHPLVIARRRPRWLAAAAIAGMALFVPSSAFAHATFVRSLPPPGAQIRASPAQISVAFSEPLNHQLSALTLTATNGKSILVRVGRAENTACVDSSRHPL